MIRSGLLLLVVALTACAQQGSRLATPAVLLQPSAGGTSLLTPQTDRGGRLGTSIIRWDLLEAANVNARVSSGGLQVATVTGIGVSGINSTGNPTFVISTAVGSGEFSGAIAVHDVNLAGNAVALFVPSGLAASYSLILPAALPGTTQCLQSDAAGVMSFTACGGGSPPFIDTTPIVYDSLAPTVGKIALKANLLTAARNLSAQDFDYKIAAVDHTQTFTANQTFSANILASGTPDIGAPATPFANTYATNSYAEVFKICAVGSVCGSTWTMFSATSNDMRIHDNAGNLFSEFDKTTSIALWKASLLPGSSSPAVYDIGSVTSPWLHSYIQQGFFTTAAGLAITATSSNAFNVTASIDNTGGGSALSVSANCASCIAFGMTNANPAGVQLQFGPGGAGGIFSVNYYVNNGAPAGACDNGDMYHRKDGAAGTTFYGCRAGAWAAWF